MKCPCEKGICDLLSSDNSCIGGNDTKYAIDMCINALDFANTTIFSRRAMSTPSASQHTLWIIRNTGQAAKTSVLCFVFSQPPEMKVLRNRP